jgi:hypothetical protein
MDSISADNATFVFLVTGVASAIVFSPVNQVGQATIFVGSGSRPFSLIIVVVTHPTVAELIKNGAKATGYRIRK